MRRAGKEHKEGEFARCSQTAVFLALECGSGENGGGRLGRKREKEAEAAVRFMYPHPYATGFPGIVLPGDRFAAVGIYVPDAVTEFKRI